MDQKFLDLELDHKEEEITVEEFCRREAIELIGFVARRSDGLVQENRIVKRFGEYFWMSDIRSKKVEVGKGFKKKKILQTTARLTMEENYSSDNYKLLDSCPIIIAVRDLDSDFYIDHFQRNSKRYGFDLTPEEVMQAKKTVNNEVEVDIFINNKYVGREEFLAL